MSTSQQNNCNIFTVYPMGVNCETTNATSYGSDGSMTLHISGGTSPYTIQWSTGDEGQTTLSNIVPGEYTAIVTDYYGDYTKEVTCVVEGPTPAITPSSTPAPTPSSVPTYPSNMCLTMNQSPYTQYEFDYQGVISGKPSWSGTTYDVVFDSERTRWVLSGFTGSLVQNSNITIPTGTWTELGTSNTWAMVTGTCVTMSLNAELTTTDVTCTGSDNGTVSVNAWGGTAPYQYSIDSVNYQSSSLFTNLVPGNGTVYIKDANNNIITRSYTIGSNTSTQYTLTLSTSTTTTSNAQYNKGKSVTWTASVSPSLPSGVSVSAVISINNFFTDYYFGSQNAVLSSGHTINENGNAVVNSTNDSVNGSSGKRFCGGDLEDGFHNSGYTRTYNVTLSGGTISGTDTFNVSHSQPLSQGCPVYGQNYYTIGLYEVVLNGTNCGSVSGTGGTNQNVSTSPYPQT
jgi:hypothetical protein